MQQYYELRFYVLQQQEKQVQNNQQQQSVSYLNDDNICTVLILEEAEKLYNKLTTKLTNEIIAATADMKTALPLLPSNNMQNLTHKNVNTYQTEGSRSHDRLEIYNTAQRNQINDDN